jgi:hypothetical protein
MLSAVAVILLVFLTRCHPEQKKKTFIISRGFYYWKSVFKNAGPEQNILQQEKIRRLYIKYFDVDWNYATHEPFPLAQIQFADKPGSSLQVIPVVFITNRCVNQIDSSSIPLLADRIALMLDGISDVNDIKNIPEIQIDCDWTEKTSNKYFFLLNELRHHSFFSGKQLSATIRLYQAKYHSRTGVPPVDKGLLMAYNMGNIKNPGAGNSILDPAELNKYSKDLNSYPLPLDLALPLFSWHVWFNSDQTFKGLVHDYDLASLSGLPVEPAAGNKFLFTRDCDTLGFSFKKGDLLRKEESNLDDIINSGKLLAKHLTGDSLALSCFHLDSVILKKYPADDLEKIFNCLNN